VLPSRAFALTQSACCGAVGLLDRPTDCGFSLVVGGLKMCEQDAQRPNVRAMVRMFQDTGAEIHTHCFAIAYVLAGRGQSFLMHSAKVCHFMQSWMLRNNFTTYSHYQYKRVQCMDKYLYFLTIYLEYLLFKEVGFVFLSSFLTVTFSFLGISGIF
jgi:hypothetical protein